VKILLVLFAILFSCPAVEARDVQLLNPDFFGQSASAPVKLLLDKKADEVEPYMVTADVKCGRYHAASVFYRKRLTFAEVRTSWNKQYGKYESLTLFEESRRANWRVEDKRFIISLYGEEEGVIRVSYIQFRPTKDVFLGIMKATGSDIDVIEDLGDAECKKHGEEKGSGKEKGQ